MLKHAEKKSVASFVKERKPLLVGVAGVAAATLVVFLAFTKSDYSFLKVKGEDRIQWIELETTRGGKFTLQYDRLSRNYQIRGIDGRIALVFVSEKSAPSKDFIANEVPKLKHAKIITIEDNSNCILTRKEYECASVKKGFPAIGDIKIAPTTLLFDESGKIEGRLNGYVEIQKEEKR